MGRRRAGLPPAKRDSAPGCDFIRRRHCLLLVGCVPRGGGKTGCRGADAIFCSAGKGVPAPGGALPAVGKNKKGALGATPARRRCLTVWCYYTAFFAFVKGGEKNFSAGAGAAQRRRRQRRARGCGQKLPLRRGRGNGNRWNGGGCGREVPRRWGAKGAKIGWERGKGAGGGSSGSGAGQRGQNGEAAFRTGCAGDAVSRKNAGMRAQAAKNFRNRLTKAPAYAIM